MTESGGITTQETTVDGWTSALAEAGGSPGGGAAVGVMLAIAASLTSMVAGYTRAGAAAGGDEGHSGDGGRGSGSGSGSDDVAALRARALDRREAALRLADDDAVASEAFGAAFRLAAGPEREEAIRAAAVQAARASAALGENAVDAIDDLAWLAEHGNPALIADVVVAFGALRAALTGARTNVSFDLASLRSSGLDLAGIRRQQPELWQTVTRLDTAIARIDALTAAVDTRAAPTDVTADA